MSNRKRTISVIEERIEEDEVEEEIIEEDSGIKEEDSIMEETNA
jgi:hypothetical protein